MRALKCVQQGALSPVEQGSVTFRAAAMATAASAALPPCCSMRIPACKEWQCRTFSWQSALHCTHNAGGSTAEAVK